MVGAGGEPWLASFMGKIFKIGTVHDMTHSRPLSPACPIDEN